MVTYGRESHVHDQGQIADAQLLLREEMENAGARFVGHRFKDLRQTGDLQQAVSQSRKLLVYRDAIFATYIVICHVQPFN